MSNTEYNFLEQRRQPFLTEGYFLTYEKAITTQSFPYFLNALMETKGSNKPEDITDQRDCTYALAKYHTALLHLRYTAGLPIDDLRKDMDEVVIAWENYTKVLRQFKEDATWPAFWAPYRVDYTRMIGLVGLSVLLCRTDLLPRINALIGIYRGNDTLLDELMNPFVSPAVDADEYAWFIDEPYEMVIDAIDSTTPAEQSSLMAQAVADWYPANEGEPFHDSHKDVDDAGDGGYCGYWCFELAALCVIKNIGDSSFRDHVVYPKDLADYARAYAQKQTPPNPAPTTGEVRTANPGSICPQAGTWITTALLDNRKLEMQLGDTFPIQDRDRSGNAVIWYLKLPTHQGDSPTPDTLASANTKTTCRVGDTCPTSGIWEPSLPKTNRNAPALASSPNRFHKVKAGSPMPEVYAKFMAPETADADNAAVTWTLVRAD